MIDCLLTHAHALPPPPHTHTGIHECSVLNHGCGGDETLCLISNSLDRVCQCPANMFKQVHQDPAGQDIETCRSELHQCSCHTLTSSHSHTLTHTHPHAHSLVYPHPPHTHHTLTISYPPSHAFSYMSTLIHLTLSPPHPLTPSLSCRCRLTIAHCHPGGNPLPPYPHEYLSWHPSPTPYWSTV